MPQAACVVLTVLAVVCGHAAQAQTMPAAYLGVWAAADASCDLAEALPADAPEGEFPLLVVTPEGYAGHEATCRLAAIGPARATRQPADALSLTCEGEGMTWSVTETWSGLLMRRQTGGWDLRQARLSKDGATYKRCAIAAAQWR